MVFFILFVVVPSSRSYWRLLVSFTGLVLVSMYIWNIAITTQCGNKSCQGELYEIGKAIGIDANVTTSDVPGHLLLRGTHSFPGTVVIFLCVSLQMPLFTASRQKSRSNEIKEQLEKNPIWIKIFLKKMDPC